VRVFIGLDIDETVRKRIQSFIEEVRVLAPDAKWVRPESLHVTLKFIGEKPADTVERIKNALGKVKGKPIELGFRGYGFFPHARSARVFWVGVEAGPELGQLATSVDEATAKLGLPKEDRPFSPHLTLARGGGGSGSPRHKRGDGPNSQFEAIQNKLAKGSPVEFGNMVAREFVLYQSQLMAGGSRYTKIAVFPLEPEPS
jgi:2'-5' RNA ligase